MGLLINEVARVVAQLVATQGVEAAQLHIEEHLVAEYNVVKAKADRLWADIGIARNIVGLMTQNAEVVSGPESTTYPPGLAGHQSVVGVPAQPSPVTPPMEVGRRRVVIDVAREMSQGGKNEVHTGQVIVELVRRGLPIEGKRPGTAIGNILARAPEWERVKEGVYRLKAQPTEREFA